MHLTTDTRSSNQHFASVPTISRSRNAFSIAEKHVTTIQFDYLYPLYWKYIYPGDTIAITQAVMARLQTQIGPLYDDLYIDAHAWFVPMRLLQTNWARYQFNTKVTGPTQDNSSLTSPLIDVSTLGAGGFTSKSLYDYFGLPTKIDFTNASYNPYVNNYLGRAYNFIYNASYLDQNLQTPAVVDLDDGTDLVSDYVLLKRGKRHDVFTSCLTAQQKGTAVTLPLGTSANVLGIGIKNQGSSTSTDLLAFSDGTASNQTGWIVDATAAGGANNKAALYVKANGSYPQIYADLTGATSATLNQVRSAYAVQHLLEADARGGTRDVESIQHRWGVTVPDFRLQRPEYLGGATWSFDGHIVPQTSATSGSNYQAGLAQFSQTLGGLSIAHSFVEHGVFMILVNARSNITYQEGLQRELSYRTRYDWYQPEFSNLGEVAVLNKEIYAQGTSADSGTFGYQEYAYELRYSKNRVSGEMRSNYTTSLDSRHMADDYSSLPTLGSAWIVSNTAITRNIAISAATADPIQINQFVNGKIARTLPMYSIPGLSRL